MTDFIGLSLGFDATQFVQGTKVAVEQLNQLQTKVRETEKSTAGVGNAGGGATAGTVKQLSVGLDDAAVSTRSLTQQFSELIQLGVGSQFLNTTLHVTKLGSAMAGLAGASHIAGFALKSLHVAAAAGPWIAVTLAIIGVGSALYSMTEKTDDAIGKFTELKKSLNDIKVSEHVASISPDLFLPGSYSDQQLKSLESQRERLKELAQTTLQTGTQLRGTDLAAQLGLTTKELATLIEKAKIPTVGVGSGITRDAPTTYNDPFGQRQFEAGGYSVAPSTAVRVFGARSGQLFRQENTLRTEARGDYESAEFRVAEQNLEIKNRETAEKVRIESAKRAMDELNEKAQRFGDTVGGAFVDAASGARSLADIMRSIGLDFAKQTASSAFADLYKLIAPRLGGGGSGRTLTQERQDAAASHDFDSEAFTG